MNVLEAIRRKRTVRKYTDQPIPQDTVEQILYAGRRAQSSKNLQPWHFIAIQSRDTLTALSKLGDYATHLPTAALAIAIITPDPASQYAVMFDAGQAAAYMQLAALDLGIGSGIITLHRAEPSREILGYPSNLHLLFLLAFGYPQDPTAAFSPASRPGGRLPTSEIIHYEHWQSQSPAQPAE
ncbi:MAG TPA: nitroreductase family protein [Chloroflexia bacterium]|nr:nitroreductase family protein [Chloroflexia bacterium]